MTAFCRYIGVCGGCAAPHLSYASQLDAKDLLIRSRLAPILGARADALRGTFFERPASPLLDPRHFRQKVSFVFGSGPGHRLMMGHYERGSRRVVPVAECPVHSARGNRLAFALRDHLERAGIGADGSGRPGILRHLLIRTTADDREAVAMLVVTRNDRALRAPVRAWLASADRPDGFFVNVHTAPGPYMVGPETVHVDGRRHVRERIGGLSFLVAPTAFFQTNVHAAAELQAAVLDRVSGARRVLDLYCGSGLLSLPLARAGARVVAVEENRQAIEDAEANRSHNRIPPARVRFVPARVEDAVASVGGTWDAVILDPPRQGCSPRVLQAVFGELAPPRVVYVSCNIDALAVELPTVLRAGYRVSRVQAVDMFPHTEHIETVVALDRGAGPSAACEGGPVGARGSNGRRRREALE